MGGTAIMMFGKDPQRFFPRSRVRFIRYEGTEAKVGAEMNVIKDKMFQGRILDLVEQTIEYVREFGEGVDRMYRAMEEAGLPEPEYNIDVKGEIEKSEKEEENLWDVCY